MDLKSVVIAAALGLCGFAAFPGHCACPMTASSGSSTTGVRAENGQKLARILAKITPGATTKAQVRSVLGAPWRTVQYNDMDKLEDEIWEYRGTDADGTYRIHIEFDHHDVVRVVGKIPDTTAGGKGTAAKAAPTQSAQTP